MKFHKVIFWLHLCCAVIICVVVFIMSLTGVALTYQKQVTAWADQRLYRIQTPADATQLPPETLIEKFREAMPAASPASVTLYSDSAMAATVTAGPSEIYFLNPYTGEILSTGSRSVRTFFRVITNWHRWLALSGEYRGVGRALTGACNLAFLFLVITGLYLWLPQKWTLRILQTFVWFRGGLSGKARDSNWHYVFGFWCAVPLVFIIASAVVISYPWASRMAFRFAGSQPSLQSGPPGAQRGGTPTGSAERGAMNRSARSVPLELAGTDDLVVRIREQTDGWQTINFQLPKAGDKTIAFTIDTGSGVKPQLRSTVVLDKNTGRVVRSEGFMDLQPGLKARLWLRFVHTGEYYGVIGQTIAGIASAASVILVYTGLALTFRRFRAWIGRCAER
jgi:uncharacterized iron-regulated membrane protein